MKKIFLCFISLICLFCVSCSEESSDEKEDNLIFLDDISFEFAGQTIQLDTSMSAQDVFDVIYSIIDIKEQNEMEISPYYINRAYQKEESNIRLTKSKNAYSYGLGLYDEESNQKFETIYKSYSGVYTRTEDEYTKFFEILKTSFEEKNDVSKELNTYLKFYGKENTIVEKDEGYETGDLERHYSETIYYDTNQYNQTELKGTNVKYYNSWKDMMGTEMGKPSFGTSDYDLINDRIYFHPTIIFVDKIDSKLTDYISYSYSFTNNHIILKYHSDISLQYLGSLMNSPEITEEIINELKNKKELGDYYSMEVHLNYKKLYHAEEKDYIFADYISLENKAIRRSVGVYGNEYYDDSIVGKEYDLYEEVLTKNIFQVLDLDFAEVEKLKNTFISTILS